MIEAKQLTKVYGGSTALDGLDLKIDAGEIYCMLGANGAGKTTTIRLLLGFIRPTRGVALIGGLDVGLHPQEAKARLAYIPEQVMLYGHLTAIENLQYLMALTPAGSPDVGALEAALLEAGLASTAHRRPASTYSKGMRQKVGIALALLKNAEVLLLDEPTSGLDPAAAREFTDTIRRMGAKGTAVLMVTHDLYHARDVGTRIGIMRQGKLVEELTPDISHRDLEDRYLHHSAGTEALAR